jgi:hypothetical protein
MMNAGTFFVGILFGMLSGVAIGFFLGTRTQVSVILDLLKQFKAEGQDGKWLK